MAHAMLFFCTGWGVDRCLGITARRAKRLDVFDAVPAAQEAISEKRCIVDELEQSLSASSALVARADALVRESVLVVESLRADISALAKSQAERAARNKASALEKKRAKADREAAGRSGSTFSCIGAQCA
jgi:hypothetical protein